jgi:glycosyltransferase involved in cell wall biosynthesis
MRSPRLNELPAPPEGKSGWPWTEGTILELDTDRLDENLPRISIVSPSFNQWRFLEECIRSVLLQGYPDIELIIHDGGSKREVIEIFEKYDPWISLWVSEADRGQSHAVNKGILKSTGSFIFWLNSDDICLPGAFFKVAEAFSDNPECKIVSGQAYSINGKSEVTGKIPSYFIDWEEIVTNPGNSLRQVSTFFARELFDQSGLLDENPNLAMDTDLLVRLTEHNKPIVLNDFLAAFRVHEEANTQTMLLRWYEENDRTRGKYFRNHAMKQLYKKRSSKRWLSLSAMEKWSQQDKKRCIKNSIRNSPSILLTKDFWRTFSKQISKYTSKIF